MKAIMDDVNLQRLALACYDYWRAEALPVAERVICFKWVERVHRAKYESTFAPQQLARLARLGVLTPDDTSRGGSRRYYKLTDPDGLATLLGRSASN